MTVAGDEVVVQMGSRDVDGSMYTPSMTISAEDYTANSHVLPSFMRTIGASTEAGRLTNGCEVFSAIDISEGVTVPWARIVAYRPASGGKKCLRFEVEVKPRGATAKADPKLVREQLKQTHKQMRQLIADAVVAEHAIKFDKNYIAWTAPEDKHFLTRDFTVECWFKMPNNGSAERSLVEVKRDGLKDLWLNIAVRKDGLVHHGLMQPGGRKGAGGKTRVDDGKWHHLAFVVRWNRVVTQYVDGKMDGAWGTGVKSFENDDGRHFYVLLGGFDGYMDEFRIWNSARTTAEINASMDRMLDPNTKGLISYCDFNRLHGNELRNNLGKKVGELFTGKGTPMTGRDGLYGAASLLQEVDATNADVLVPAPGLDLLIE